MQSIISWAQRKFNTPQERKNCTGHILTTKQCSVMTKMAGIGGRGGVEGGPRGKRHM